MMPFSFSHRMAAGGVFALLPLVVASSGASSGRASDEFQLDESPALRMAVRAVRGPYWSLGDPIAEAGALMTSLGERGPIVVHYVDDPLTTPARELRCEVGFVLGGEEKPLPATHAIVERAPQLVLRRSLDPPGRYETRVHMSLREEASRRGLRPVGPVLELIEAVEDGGVVRPVRVEIQMPVCVAEAEPIADHHGVESSDDEATADDPPPPARQEDPAPDSRTFIADAAEAALRRASDHEAGMPDVGESEDKAASRTAASLIESGRHAELAERLLPDGSSQRLRAWENQFVLRMAALARGMEKQYPGECVWISDAARALVARAETLSRRRSSEPRRSAASILAALEAESRARWEEREAILRKLDHLMGRVAFRSQEAPAIADEIRMILSETASLRPSE